jgi:hypothetical protein
MRAGSAGGARGRRMMEEYMPGGDDLHPATRESDLIQALRDVADVERIRVNQEQAKVTFGSASIGPRPGVDLSEMGPTGAWWSEGKRDSAAGGAAAGLSIMRQALSGAGASTAAGIVGGLAAGAMGGPGGLALAGAGAAAQVGGMALGATVAPQLAQYSGVREGLVSTHYSTDESYTKEMGNRYGYLRSAEAEYGTPQVLMEAGRRNRGEAHPDDQTYARHVADVTRERARAVQAQVQDITNLESVRGGVKERLEHFFAPFGKAGMYPSRDMMEKIAPLFKMQADAMRHIDMDAEATASKFAKQPGNEARQIGK